MRPARQPLILQISNINEQLKYIYDFFRSEVEAKGMTLSLHCTLPDKNALIRTDREKIFAIFTNLVKNSIKYSDSGMIDFGYTLKKNTLEFYVKDTGKGIPKERQKAIFERFIQADIEDKMALQGAGLGLSISKAYIEMLGGTIWVDSEVGIGSTFYFTLPYENGDFENSTVKEMDVVEPYKIKNIKVLIAEDDEVSKEYLKLILSKYTREIIYAGTGNEAIEACKTNPDLDLIFMDIRMPDLNGFQATEEIRKINNNVIIIMQTAYAFSDDREKSLNAGCNDYISKPFDKDIIIGLIHKYFPN